jgi:F-type H+-transporting ATPase subunit b
MKAYQWIVPALWVIPVLALGAEHGDAAAQYYAVAGRSTDFLPRIVNFLIFAGLAYYLVARPIKDYFVGRRTGIADRLNAIEAKLQEAKDARKRAEQAVEESKVKAKEIAADTEKEIVLLKQRFEETIERDLVLLEKQQEEKQEMEERKMVRETLDSVLDSGIAAEDIPLSADTVIDLVAKKVA